MKKREQKEEMHYDESGLHEVSNQIMNVYSAGTFDRETEAPNEDIENEYK
ncbi:hypothetical protein [Falsibacillus albus]|nr:hypothetical protein [Falsibacillus albus]